MALSATAAIGAIGAIGLGGSPAGAASARAGTGDVPMWATPGRKVGPAHGRADFAFVLPLRHRSELRDFNAAVSDPGSPSYAHYLSPSKFRARYAPSAAHVQAAKDWLEAHGFRIEDAAASGILIRARGPLARAERDFNTRVNAYRYRGRRLRAPANSVAVPRSLRGEVRGIVGLDDTFARPLGLPPAPPPPLFKNAPPCSQYWGEKEAFGAPRAYANLQPYAPCGYKPKQLEGAYGMRDAIDNGNDGGGQTVTIIDAFAAPTIDFDANEYSSRRGLPPVTINQQVFSGCMRGCTDANQQGWYGEETLDVEAVHAMAPGATIQYVGAADSGLGLDFALAYVVDNAGSLNTNIVTNSYGFLGEAIPKHRVVAEEEVHQQAVAEGVGLYFSSGDDGDEHDTIGFTSADYSASSPDSTAVGGTTLGVGPLENYRFEVGWGTHVTSQGPNGWAPKPPGPFLYGSGGGISRMFGEPDYQQGVVPDRLATRYGGEGRVVPDISMDGDPGTGMLVGETQTFPNGQEKYAEYRIGGTSLSSPLFAGVMALADQNAGFPHGFVNPALYSLAGTDAIRDVRPAKKQIAMVRNDYVNGANASDGVATSLRSADLNRTLHTTNGYDDVTGLGSPNGQDFLDALGP